MINLIKEKTLILAILLCLPSLLWAEVGVVVEGHAPYVFGIIDDPDPVPTVWRQFSTQHTNRVVLNAQGEQNGDGRPSILYNALTHLPIAAWSKNSPNGYDVVISRFTNGSWTEPQVLAGSAADELDPFLIMNPSDGSVHVVYWIHDAAPRVMHREAPADLTSWSEALQISQPGQIACRPSGIFYEGVLHVAYEVHDFGYGMTPRQIVLSTENEQDFLMESLATTYHPGGNWPQVHTGNGRLWLDWIDAEGEMTWRRRQSASPWEPVEIETYATPEERDYHVRGEIKSHALQ